MNKKILFLLFCFTFELLPMDYVSGVFSATISFAKKFIASETVKTVVVASASAIVATKYFSKVSSWFTQNRQEQKAKGEPDTQKPTPKYQNGFADQDFVTHDQFKQLTKKLKSFLSELQKLSSGMKEIPNTLENKFVSREELKKYALKDTMLAAESHQLGLIIPLREKVDEKFAELLSILKQEILDRTELSTIVAALNKGFHELMKDGQEKYNGLRSDIDELKKQNGSLRNGECSSAEDTTDARIPLHLIEQTECPDSPGENGSRIYRSDSSEDSASYYSERNSREGSPGLTPVGSSDSDTNSSDGLSSLRRSTSFPSLHNVPDKKLRPMLHRTGSYPQLPIVSH